MAAASETTESSRDLKFRDLDDFAVFEETRQRAAAADCQNFVLEFGPSKAWIARDYNKGDFETLFQQDRDADHPIRWINIWDTGAQSDVVDFLGTKYAFSPRLIAIMKNSTVMKKAAAEREKRKAKAAAAKLEKPRKSLQLPSKNVSATHVDPEKGISEESSESTIADEKFKFLEGEEIELFLLFKDTVNYSSIDHSEKSLCVGAHWLHKRPPIPGQGDDIDQKYFMPPKHWLWLTLCDDNTVITFHESPALEATPKGADAEDWKRAQFKNMRANSLDVLLQQSIHGIELYNARPLTQNSIRSVLKQVLDQSANPSRPELSRIHSDGPPFDNAPGVTLEQEGTSRLFYYLFEDYSAAGPLRAAGRILEDLTPKVLHSSDRKRKIRSRDIIPPLHILSKDLRTLQHLFENYKTLITKIMAAAGQREMALTDPRRSFLSMSRSYTNLSEPHVNSRVFLTQSAMQRFDRLRDRLQGLMLNTIKGYLGEITALSDTYFNLTQQKDSNATARLTRSATLIAKLSVFFLPITFMTSYFSVQIEELYTHWSGNDYWYSFAVIASVSFVLLTFFGRVLEFFSDVMDEWTAKVWSWLSWLASRVGLVKARASEDDED